MANFAVDNFIRDIKGRTVGAFHEWLSSDEGINALAKFVETQFESLSKLGAVQRVTNLIIVSSVLQDKGILSAPYNTAPWILFLSCDMKAWAAFENNYFEYYIQCSSILV